MKNKIKYKKITFFSTGHYTFILYQPDNSVDTTLRESPNIPVLSYVCHMTDDVIGLVWRSLLVSFFTVKHIRTYMF